MLLLFVVVSRMCLNVHKMNNEISPTTHGCKVASLLLLGYLLGIDSTCTVDQER